MRNACRLSAVFCLGLFHRLRILQATFDCPSWGAWSELFLPPSLNSFGTLNEPFSYEWGDHQECDYCHRKVTPFRAGNDFGAINSIPLCESEDNEGKQCPSEPTQEISDEASRESWGNYYQLFYHAVIPSWNRIAAGSNKVRAGVGCQDGRNYSY